jgi:hypothetical protein
VNAGGCRIAILRGKLRLVLRCRARLLGCSEEYAQ